MFLYVEKARPTPQQTAPIQYCVNILIALKDLYKKFQCYRTAGCEYEQGFSAC